MSAKEIDEGMRRSGYVASWDDPAHRDAYSRPLTEGDKAFIERVGMDQEARIDRDRKLAAFPALVAIVTEYLEFLNLEINDWESWRLSRLPDEARAKRDRVRDALRLAEGGARDE